MNIESLIKKHSRQKNTWFDRLDQSPKKELEAIKKKFASGGYGQASQQAVAKAIIEAAKERGWPVSGVQGVISWLRR